MRHQDKPAIAIVGAGIGGLATAAALRKLFFDPIVYEQASAFARVGAGIELSPNAVKVFRWLGIEDRLRQSAFAPQASVSRDSVSGKITREDPLGREIETRYGAPLLTVHRGDLHALLAATVPAHSIKLGKSLVDIESRGTRVHLTFADGSEVQADAVVGADGAHSLVRDRMVGPALLRYTGRTAYRSVFPATLLPAAELGTARVTWWGRDRHVTVGFTTAQRDEVYILTSQPEKAGPGTKHSWSMQADPAELRAAFATFPTDVQRLLAAAPQVQKRGIPESDPLPAWGKGRVVLLGDACHPMPPYMGSAAAMALEDAVVLANAIDEADSFETAFRLYEAARKPRANAVQIGSSKSAWIRTETNPEWLYGYDAARVPIRSKLAADNSTYYES
jgi:salicylate hydroxylase/6-hydroxynicotinate 3-monooxygenase